MAISAKAVMALREKMGISMMECKKALVETDGDEAAAIELLKEKGAAKAEKKSDRTTGEGTIIIEKNAYVKLLCETDFVARNDDFIAFAKELAEKTAQDGVDATKAYFDEVKAEKITQLGENLVLDEIGVLEGDIVGGYVHSNGKVAGMVALSGGTDELAKDLGMHIVGMKPTVLSFEDIEKSVADAETAGRIAAVEEENNERERLGKPLKNIPKFVSRSQIDDAVLADITEEIKEGLRADGKPEKIWDHILPGKIQRFIDDNTSFDIEHALLSQDFVKDPSKKIQTLVEESNATIAQFVRIAI